MSHILFGVNRIALEKKSGGVRPTAVSKYVEKARLAKVVVYAGTCNSGRHDDLSDRLGTAEIMIRSDMMEMTC